MVIAQENVILWILIIKGAAIPTQNGSLLLLLQLKKTGWILIPVKKN